MRLKCLVEAFNALTDFFFGSNGAPDTFTKCYQNSNKDAIFKATLLPKKVHFLYPHLRTYPTVNYDLVSKSVQIVPVVPFSFFFET